MQRALRSFTKKDKTRASEPAHGPGIRKCARTKKTTLASLGHFGKIGMVRMPRFEDESNNSIYRRLIEQTVF